MYEPSEFPSSFGPKSKLRLYHEAWQMMPAIPTVLYSHAIAHYFDGAYPREEIDGYLGARWDRIREERFGQRG